MPGIDNNKAKMSLKMGIETAIHIGRIELSEFNKVGWVSLSLALYYCPQGSDQ